jgi:hypothetical protein
MDVEYSSTRSVHHHRTESLSNTNTMKTKTLIAILTACSISAFAGTTEMVTEPTPAQVTWVENFAQSILNSSGLSIAAYPSYGRDLNIGGTAHPFGFGIAAMYPVSQYAFAGMRLDYLNGNFWAPSATVGAKYTVKNLPFSPTVFTVGGLIMPLSGAGDATKSVGAITGIGFDANILHRGNYSLDLFIEGEKWTNLPGTILHFGLAGGVKF